MPVTRNSGILEVFIGQRIIEMRRMTEEEVRDEGWEDRIPLDVPLAFPTIFVLANGVKFYASTDDEGNGPGAMFGVVHPDREEAQFFHVVAPFAT